MDVIKKVQRFQKDDFIKEQFHYCIIGVLIKYGIE